MPLLSMLSTIRASASAEGPYLTLTYVATAQDSPTNNTIIHPTSVQAGDLCILFLYGWDNDSEEFLSTNRPSGFTHIMTTPDVSSTQSSITASYAILASTSNTDYTQPGMDSYGYVAFYYRISGGDLDSIISLPGGTSYAAGVGDPSGQISIPGVDSEISYISFVASSSNAAETYHETTDVSIQQSQYAEGTTAASLGTFDIGVGEGPVGIGTAEAFSFPGASARHVHIIGGRLGFVKA